MVDICNEDLYILDPQFEEKDEIDLLTSEEVIDFGVSANGSSAPDETDQGSQSCPAPDSDQTSDNPSGNSLPSRFSSDFTTLPQLNSNNTPYNSEANTSEGNQFSFSSMSPTTNRHQKQGTSRLNTLECVPNSLSINSCDFGGKFANHNGSLGLSPLSPQPYSIDSPPRSPRRGQKMPQTYMLQEQLVLASQKGNVDWLKELHHKGVNLMLTDAKGMTSLHHAVINGRDNAVAFLLNAFTPDMLDHAEKENGQTALHKAVLSGNREICTSLAIRGASLNVKDHQGRSAQELAQYLGQHDLAATLTRK